MAILWIEEYDGLSKDEQGVAIPAPSGAPTNQQVTIGATSLPSSALQASTRYVRMHADTACYIKLGTSPTAAANTTSEHLMANTYVDRVVPKGLSYKIAVITA
jgi:hypothetical protein